MDTLFEIETTAGFRGTPGLPATPAARRERLFEIILGDGLPAALDALVSSLSAGATRRDGSPALDQPVSMALLLAEIVDAISPLLATARPIIALEPVYALTSMLT